MYLHIRAYSLAAENLPTTMLNKYELADEKHVAVTPVDLGPVARHMGQAILDQLQPSHPKSDKLPAVKKNKNKKTGASGWLSWLSIQLLILAQVMISRFMRSSPALGSVLAVQILLGLSLPLSLSHPLLLSLSLSLSK